MRRIASLLVILLAWPFYGYTGDIDLAKLKAEIKAELRKEILAEMRADAAREQKAKPGQKAAVKPGDKSPAATQVAAAPEPAKKDGLWLGDKVKFTGQVRIRPEFRHNLTQSIPNVPTNAEEDLSVLLRTRFGMQFTPTEHIGFFVQGQDSRDFGEEAAGVPTAGGDDEGLDLHQGYIDVTDIGGKPFMIRAGRQEVRLGEERLVGAVEWSNVGRSLDGVVLAYEPENWGLKGFGFIANRTVANVGDGAYFGGLYGTWKKFPGGVWDGYYMVLQDSDGATGAAAGTGDTQSVHTIGTRIAAKYDSGVDFGVEGAVQLGKFGSNSILAYAGHGAAGYTFDTEVKPRVGLEYNYATGDDTASNRYTKFNNLWPANHGKYGLMDLTGWSNIHDASFQFGVKPGKFAVNTGYHLLAVDKNHSAGDNFAGSAAFAGAPGLGKIAGHELDLFGKWTMNPYFDVGAGYSHFIPGSFLKDQGYNKQSDFFYLQLSSQLN